MNNRQAKIKSFLSKYNKLLIFSFTLIISGIVFYYFAFAESEDDNKFTINNVNIISVKDGTEGFDSNDNDGNDSSNNNGIVRNFDSINYQVSFDLNKKNEEETINASDKRTILVDVLYKGDIDGSIMAGENASRYELKDIFDGYKYVEFSQQVDIGSNTIDFTLENVNALNKTKISPIVIIKESTDADQKVISNLDDSVKTSSFDSVASNFTNNKNSCSNLIGEETTCDTVITGVEDYFVRLYSGSVIKDNLDSNFPIGFIIGLNNRKTDTNLEKGIKGLLLPTSVSFDISADALSDGTSISYVNNSERFYKNSSTNPNGGLNYKIFIDSNNSVELPEAIMDDYKGNGEISASSLNNGKLVKITVNNIKNKVVSLDDNSYYVSTNSFEIKSSRDSFEGSRSDIDILVSASNDNGELSRVTVTDNYSRFVGTYESKIDLYDSLDDLSDSKAKTDGLADFNYNEDFYINTSFQYGIKSGDGLENITNYIKIDNDAILLILINGSEYQASTGVINDSYVAPKIGSVVFGYGKWSSDYFRVKEDAPSGCPLNLSSLTKENLMNLYGGPCIEENENVKWSDNFEGINKTGTKIVNDNELAEGPIIVKSIYEKGSNAEYIYPTTNANLILRAKVKNNYNLVNTTHQIVTSATGVFKNDAKEESLYYLSNQNNTSNVEVMKNPNNFIKTNYNFAAKAPNSINTTTCDSLSCSVTGNTILVSGVRVAKPEVRTFYNDFETINFYYYPIEWRINANAYRNDNENNTTFEGANIYIYIPSYLRYVSFGNKDGFKEPSNSEDVNIDGENYKKLTYTYSQAEISNGRIPELSVYTNLYLDTPNNAKPKVLVTADFIVKKRIEGANSTFRELTFSAITNDSERTRVVDNVTIHNNANVTTQGTVTPTYFERNGSYSFKMQAYNNSSSNEGEGVSYQNATLYYVLPYNNDSAFEDLSSKFNATSFKVKLSNIPSGYTVYYTNGVSSNIISNEIDETTNPGYNWTEWTNPEVETTNVTAIKIVKTGTFDGGNYFGGEDGIVATVTPLNASAGDTFYNTFYLITDKPNNIDCNSNNGNQCNETSKSNKIYYSSSRIMSSIYNRQISGIVFEDYDYSGLYDSNESRLENIPVSIYKINDESINIDNNNPSTYVNNATWVADTTTNINGEYVVRGLSEGKYFVKFTYNNDKYTPTDKDIKETKTVETNVINSKALPLPDSNVAISSVITFDNNSVKANDINLGLKIRKQFAVDIKKFITNVTVTSASGTDSYDYNNATEVTLNVRNPRNTTAKVKYSFVIENTKYFPGYVGIIADRIPDGMTFSKDYKENQDWVLNGNTLYYTGLSGRLLIPGNKYYFNLILDLNITSGGTYTNVVAAKDLVLMGDEISGYDFGSSNVFEEIEEEPEVQEEEEEEEIPISFELPETTSVGVE